MTICIDSILKLQTQKTPSLKSGRRRVIVEHFRALPLLLVMTRNCRQHAVEPRFERMPPVSEPQADCGSTVVKQGKSRG